MLQSVIATVNRLGLESLRFEDDAKSAVKRSRDTRCSVWAVVDSEDLREVHRALLAAHPSEAFQLLNERAVSIGSFSA